MKIHSSIELTKRYQSLSRHWVDISSHSGAQPHVSGPGAKQVSSTSPPASVTSASGTGDLEVITHGDRSIAIVALECVVRLVFRNIRFAFCVDGTGRGVRMIRRKRLVVSVTAWAWVVICSCRRFTCQCLPGIPKSSMSRFETQRQSE